MPAELQRVATALEARRSELTDAELERVKRRILAAHSPQPRGPLMRSTLAITAMLTAGVVFSGGGAALGISALSTTDDASIAQYGTLPTATVPQPAGADAVEPGTSDEGSRGEVLGETVDGVSDEAVEPTQESAQAPRQLAADSGDGELPFTGLAAIPMLVFGFTLLVIGLVLRRTTPRSSDRT